MFLYYLFKLNKNIYNLIINKMCNDSNEKIINKLNKLINTLPSELINIIINYTYQFIPIDLKNDIVSYVNSKSIVEQLFIKRNYPSYDEDKYIIYNNLSFHIVCFMRGLHSLYSNTGIYTLDHILNRHSKWLNIDFFLKKLIKIDKNSYINKLKTSYLWALLTKEEREEFISINKTF